MRGAVIRRYARPVPQRRPVAVARAAVPEHALESCDAAVRRITGADPASWEGTLRVQCPGKAGELVFLTGVLPGIRRRLPRARVVLATMEHYRPAVDHAGIRFDAVEHLPMSGPTLVDAISVHYMDRVHDGFLPAPDGIFVNAYRSHGQARPRGFPQAFAESVGIPAGEYERCSWDDGEPRAGALALAFPTTNRHSSVRGRLPLHADDWARLSGILSRRGLRCVATGHPADPAPGAMPGWEWIDCGLREALRMVRGSSFVVGANSGMTFLAAAVGSGPVVMLDEADHGRLPLYDPPLLGQAIDAGRLLKIRIEADGAADRSAVDAVVRVAERGMAG